MNRRTEFPWAIVALVAVAAALIVAAIIEIGPPGSSSRTEHTLITAEDGVVQSTVTGTGNVEPSVNDTVNFKTSGTLQSIDVHVGEHVTKGQLLGTLDPASAQLALDQAKASFTSAQDQLTTAESSASTTSTSYDLTTAASSQFVAYTPGTSTASNEGVTVVGGSVPSGTSTTPSTPSTSRAPSTPSATTPSATTTPARASSTTTKPSSTTTPSSSTTNTASSLASAQAAVDSAQANVASAKQTLDDTKLYAPASGTVVSLESVSPGDAITAGSSGNTSSSSGTGSSSSSGGSGASTAGGLGNSGGSSSSSSSSSSTGFVDIVNSKQLTMTVAFSESDISQVKVGQPATISLDALTGVELAAKVTSIDTVGQTSSGVVSYNATLTLTQNDSKVLPGMSASASVITGQASGVNLPNDAVTGNGSLSTVSLMKNGKTTSQQVVVGLKGDSRTLIVSGLTAGDQVMVTTVLPALGSSSSATPSSSSSGTLGGTGLGGGGAGFAARALAGGGGGFFRGGGGG